MSYETAMGGSIFDMTRDEAWEAVKTLGAHKLDLRQSRGWQNVLDECGSVNRRLDVLLEKVFPRPEFRR